MTPEKKPRDLSSFEMRRQPDDTTCGPTCLHAVYRHFGEDVALDDLLRQVPALDAGGTLGVLLATHALRRGYRAKILTWNLLVFDPSWFGPSAPPLRERLLMRAEATSDLKLRLACRSYVDYLDAGGKVEMQDLAPEVLHHYLRRGFPILTGLSATFLYREPRELPDCTPDDVRGEPTGHFVVLTGYRPRDRTVLLSDPMHPNPLAAVHIYPVPVERVIGAIYLGALTHDGNLIVLAPPRGQDTRR